MNVYGKYLPRALYSGYGQGYVVNTIPNTDFSNSFLPGEQ